MTTNVQQAQEYDVATIMGGLYGDGIIALKGAFDRAWLARRSNRKRKVSMLNHLNTARRAASNAFAA